MRSPAAEFRHYFGPLFLLLLSSTVGLVESINCKGCTPLDTVTFDKTVKQFRYGVWDIFSTLIITDLKRCWMGDFESKNYSIRPLLGLVQFW